jgi:hypothetical protein
MRIPLSAVIPSLFAALFPHDALALPNPDMRVVNSDTQAVGSLAVRSDPINRQFPDTHDDFPTSTPGDFRVGSLLGTHDSQGRRTGLSYMNLIEVVLLLHF